MLTFDDCLAFSQLTKEEMDALSRHAHVPDLCALELAAHLLEGPNGSAQVEAVLRLDIEEARRRGDPAEAARLHDVLAHLQQQCQKGPAERRPAGHP